MILLLGERARDGFGARRRHATRARRLLGVAVIAFACSIGSGGDAQDAALPVPVQADLLAKVAPYDRGFAARAGAVARVVVVARGGDARSERQAQQMASALHEIGVIAGLPEADEIALVSDASRVGPLCRERRAAIVYVAPGYSDAEVRTMAAGLSGVDVLSVAAVPAYVPAGIVLGFDVSEGRPKLVANLAQARRQNVQFQARVLKLMRTVE